MQDVLPILLRVPRSSVCKCVQTRLITIDPDRCPVETVQNKTKSLKFIADVNDTAEKLFTGVNDTADKFFSGVSDTDI